MRTLSRRPGQIEIIAIWVFIILLGLAFWVAVAAAFGQLLGF